MTTEDETVTKNEAITAIADALEQCEAHEPEDIAAALLHAVERLGARLHVTGESRGRGLVDAVHAALRRGCSDNGGEAMTDDERTERLGEIDAAMGRVLWSIGRVTDDQHEAMRELLASLVRVLDEPLVLVTMGDALTGEMLSRTPPPTDERH